MILLLLLLLMLMLTMLVCLKNFGVDVHVPVHVVDDVYNQVIRVFDKYQHSDRRKSANISRKKFMIITKTFLGKGWR